MKENRKVSSSSAKKQRISDYDFEDIDDLESFEDIEDIDDMDLEDFEEEISDEVEEIEEDTFEEVDEEIEEDTFEEVDEEIEEDIEDEVEEDIKPVSRESRNKNVQKEKNSKISLGAKIASVVVVFVILVLLLLKGCGNNEKYTVKFNSNGGSSVSEQEVKKNDTVNVPKVPIRDGYEFVGWYIGNEEYDFDSKVDSDLELEARWKSSGTADVTGVVLDQTELTLLPGDSAPLIATVQPSDAKETGVTWKSSDESVAKVDILGTVTAVKNGTATITATTEEGGFTATCRVVVSEDVVKVEGISLSASNIILGVNETEKVKATITPTNATNQGVTWESSDESVATVSGMGLITGKKLGTATITAKTKDGNQTATVKVEVKEIEVISVALNKTKLTLMEGEAAKLVATVSPNNATNDKITWKSSNPSVAKVVNGNITAVSKGTAVITVTTEDGNKTASCQVTVAEPVRADFVTITGASKVSVGSAIKLTGTVSPINAVNKTITWSSSDSSIAKVNSSGVVTGVSAGTATITAKTENGKTDTHVVTVNPKAVVYTYSYTKTQVDPQAPATYVITVYGDSKDVTSSVTSIAGVNLRSTSSKIELSDIYADKITSGKLSIVVNGETQTASLK